MKSLVHSKATLTTRSQIPDKSLDAPPPPEREPAGRSDPESRENPLEVTDDPEESAEELHASEDEDVPAIRPPLTGKRRRRLSTYESSDGGMDLENDEIGGSARQVVQTSPRVSRRSLSISESA